MEGKEGDFRSSGSGLANDGGTRSIGIVNGAKKIASKEHLHTSDRAGNADRRAERPRLDTQLTVPV